MLVLSRKVGQRIMIGDNIALVINRIAGNRVTVGIEAPDSVPIVRGELELVVRSFDDDFPEDGEQALPQESTAKAASRTSRPSASDPALEGAKQCAARRLRGEFNAPLLAFRAAR